MERNKILKYLDHSASPTEIKEVETWINTSPKNSKEFNRLKATYIAATFDDTAKTTNVEDGYLRYKKNIGQKSQSNKTTLWTAPLKYAATIIIIIGISYLFYDAPFYDDATAIVPVKKRPQNEDAITLKLENGNIQVIKEDGSSQVVDSEGNEIGTQQGNSLQYNNRIIPDKLTYNTLTVPYGKRFDIILSDSSHVVLNSGTSLKYPVKFIKGKNREVYLTGEAFFDVAKNTEQPFIVNTNELNIRVFGTKFNVSAYPEDNATNTVLVEGSVGLYQEESYDSAKTTFLTPGHLASLNKKNKGISVESAETAIYTAWMTGGIIFRHVPFKNIIKKLERHYDVSIINGNGELNEELFTASFDNQPLERVLKTFKDNYGIDYTIHNDTVTINH
ncbi:FecR domain-containing protein [uncultured Kriegella sp.]|uniref:FecR family protein n=1 Tax=uncultured Kriegella sp. TaxID=1798910 RepID=UPI0030D83AB4|tara:strand:- start:23693 stop:24862 length:1170 start_codon:yes stop_codon:yes gene_type:complete